MNRSQKPNTISKITIGMSNKPALTLASKCGKTMKAKEQNTHHAEEIKPKTARNRGIYRDFNHK